MIHVLQMIENATNIIEKLSSNFALVSMSNNLETINGFVKQVILCKK